MIAKVYIVTSGAYSSYQINAAFSTREKAEAFIDGGTELYDIEEYPLDDPGDQAVRQVWTSRIYPDGRFVTTDYFEIRDLYYRGKSFISKYSPEDCAKYRWADAGQGESCISAEHAQKLAVEAYQAWLRHYKLEPKEVVK